MGLMSDLYKKFTCFTAVLCYNKRVKIYTKERT